MLRRTSILFLVVYLTTQRPYKESKVLVVILGIETMHSFMHSKPKIMLTKHRNVISIPEIMHTKLNEVSISTSRRNFKKNLSDSYSEKHF